MTKELDDMRNILSVEDFARFPRANAAEHAIVRASGGTADLANSGGRLIRYSFSDPSVGRDDHTIAAWRLDNFLRNPVFLWAHQASDPPVGRVVEIEDQNGRLVGTVEYAERDLYPFADTIFQLVKAGYLNAVSTSWDPIDWKLSTDKSRPRGVDFKLVDLLEISQVPVPALPTALVSARRAGIDTAPLYEWAERVLDGGGMIMVPRAQLEMLRKEAKMPSNGSGKRAAAEWKCGAARDLPLSSSATWDGAAAEKGVFAACGFDGDKPDVVRARKAFLAYDASAPEKKGSYKLPFAEIVDGTMRANPVGIADASSRLWRTGVPKAVEDEAGAVSDAYRKKTGKDDGRSPKIGKRGLYEVSYLAMLLCDLGFLADMVEWEAAFEEDGSLVPDQLAAACQALGAVLIAMTVEEVNEMAAAEGSDEGATVADDQVATPRAAFSMLRGPRAGDVAMTASVMRAALTGEIAAKPQARGGKVLSAANKKTLADAHAAITRGCDMMRGVIDAAEENDDAAVDDAVAQEERGRRARALHHEIGLPPHAAP